jgi:hypothetical protein
MPDLSHHGVDEFGFPLTTIQRLHRMQGIGPDQGEYGRAYGTNGRALDVDEPGDFTIEEYSMAVGENVIHDMMKGRSR